MGLLEINKILHLRFFQTYSHICKQASIRHLHSTILSIGFSKSLLYYGVLSPSIVRLVSKVDLRNLPRPFGNLYTRRVGAKPGLSTSHLQVVAGRLREWVRSSKLRRGHSTCHYLSRHAWRDLPYILVIPSSFLQRPACKLIRTQLIFLQPLCAWSWTAVLHARTDTTLLSSKLLW